MNDEIRVEFSDITKLFAVCPTKDCGAEVGIDLSGALANQPIVCPCCHGVVLDVNRQENFSFTWASFASYLLIKSEKRKPQMFFRIPRV